MVQQKFIMRTREKGEKRKALSMVLIRRIHEVETWRKKRITQKGLVATKR